MTLARTAARLAALYPREWRDRYGAELEALIVDMSEGRRVRLSVRANVLASVVQEWWRSASARRPGASPGDRVRGGTALVLWAWALFIVAGVIVQKSSEHWEGALGGGHPVAGASFAALIVGAATCAAIVLTGIVLAVPAFLSFLRAGGLTRIRSRIGLAVTLTALWLAAGSGVVVWAHHISHHARNGADAGYAIAALAWALLSAAALAAWTAAANRAAAELDMPAGTLRIEARLAIAASAGMALTTLATAMWWVAVASVSPAALAGAVGPGYTPLRPALVLAMVVMLAALGLAAVGARRAGRALPDLT